MKFQTGKDEEEGQEHKATEKEEGNAWKMGKRKTQNKTSRPACLAAHWCGWMVSKNQWPLSLFLSFSPDVCLCIFPFKFPPTIKIGNSPTSCNNSNSNSNHKRAELGKRHDVVFSIGTVIEGERRRWRRRIRPLRW